MTVNKKLIFYLFFSFLILFASCKEKDNTPHERVFSPELEDDTYIIMRLGKGYFSNIFRKLSSEEKTFSHTGILYCSDKANNSFSVYHIEANELTGVGRVKNESFKDFVKESKYYSIYKINSHDSMKIKIIESADLFYKNRVEFDLDFNLDSDNKLYCTELVAKAINKAFETDTITANLYISGKLFYSLEDIYKSDMMSQYYTTLKK